MATVVAALVSAGSFWLGVIFLRRGHRFKGSLGHACATLVSVLGLVNSLFLGTWLTYFEEGEPVSALTLAVVLSVHALLNLALVWIFWSEWGYLLARKL